MAQPCLLSQHGLWGTHSRRGRVQRRPPQEGGHYCTSRSDPLVGSPGRGVVAQPRAGLRDWAWGHRWSSRLWGRCPERGGAHQQGLFPSRTSRPWGRGSAACSERVVMVVMVVGSTTGLVRVESLSCTSLLWQAHSSCVTQEGSSVWAAIFTIPHPATPRLKGCEASLAPGPLSSVLGHVAAPPSSVGLISIYEHLGVLCWLGCCAVHRGHAALRASTRAAPWLS